MKARNGFVSNSSSSSFVILKDAITNEQKDMIFNLNRWIELFVKLEKENKDYFDEELYVEVSQPDEYGSSDSLESRFEYYDSDPWRLIEYDDFIFGETSMDNFSMEDYFEYIKIDKNFLKWDEGWNDEPEPAQLKFIKRMKQEYRKRKINKLNNL